MGTHPSSLPDNARFLILAQGSCLRDSERVPPTPSARWPAAEEALDAECSVFALSAVGSQGRSDPVDAKAVARVALSGTVSGSPKARDGNVETRDDVIGTKSDASGEGGTVFACYTRRTGWVSHWNDNRPRAGFHHGPVAEEPS